jgi:hypothetical protein
MATRQVFRSAQQWTIITLISTFHLTTTRAVLLIKETVPGLQQSESPLDIVLGDLLKIVPAQFSMTTRMEIALVWVPAGQRQSKA